MADPKLAALATALAHGRDPVEELHKLLESPEILAVKARIEKEKQECLSKIL